MPPSHTVRLALVAFACAGIATAGTPGESALHSLVPPSSPDGSDDAPLAIARASGEVERHAAAIAVLSVTQDARPGGAVELALKPALPLPTLAGLLTRSNDGGLGMALKGAMEVKEILVRAPWGELTRARMEGPLGIYVARLNVPADWHAGTAKLELVSSGTAGNVSRRSIDVEIDDGAGPQHLPLALLSMVTVMLGTAITLTRRYVYA